MKLPHSISTERGAIGAIVFGGARSYCEIAAVARAEDFYHPAHVAVMEAAADLDAASEPINIITLDSALEEEGKIRQQGGPAWLAELAAESPSVDSSVLRHYAERIRELADMRRLLTGLHNLQRKAADAHVLAPLLEEAQALVYGIGAHASDEPRSVSDLVPEVVAASEDLGRSGATLGIPSGWWELDAITGGWVPGDLHVIAGRPSMGKTAFVVNTLEHGAAHGCDDLLFSIEMKSSSLVQRMLASASALHEESVSLGAIRAGVKGKSARALHLAAERVRRLPVHILDKGAPSLADIRSVARRWRAKVPRGRRARITIDYLGLIGGVGDAPDAGRRGPRRGPRRTFKDFNRQQEVAEMTRGLKLLAKELDVPVLLLSQLNRGLEARQDKRPMLSDLRESGAVEQDADLICFLYRDEVYNKSTKSPGIAEVIVAKQRQGATGTALLKWDAPQVRFSDLNPAPRYAPGIEREGWTP